MSVSGPSDEFEFSLSRDVPKGEYHSIAQETTQTILEESPRKLSEIRLFATTDLLNNRRAVQRLCEYPGLSCRGGALKGRTTATEEILEDVFAVYEGGLHHAHFFDEMGLGIAARYDDNIQQYWLPKHIYNELDEILPKKVLKAIR